MERCKQYFGPQTFNKLLNFQRSSGKQAEAAEWHVLHATSSPIEDIHEHCTRGKDVWHFSNTTCNSVDTCMHTRLSHSLVWQAVGKNKST
eukprot:2318932-Amphidinium_carterae.1